jgi:drug/metabolite transporter (DMT)-like permease
MQQSRDDMARVILWMMGALISFSGMAVSVRLLSTSFSIFEMQSFRAGGALLLLLGLALFRPTLRSQMAPRHLGLHLTRNVIHFASGLGWVKALTILPFATVFAIEFTMPAWTALLALVFLGERMTVSRVGSVLLGFIGVLVILRPGLTSFNPAGLLVLGAALGYATTFVITKKLTGTISTFTILLWMNIIQFPLALAGSDLGFLSRLGPDTVLPALAMGITGISSHFCATQAFRYGDATVVVPIDFLRVPLIALVGWMFFNEGIEIWVLGGAAIIAAGILWNVRSETRRS